MELAILRTLKRTGEDVVLQKFDHSHFFNRLEALTVEHLPKTEEKWVVVRRFPRKKIKATVVRTEWTEEEVRAAYRKAFGALIRELREEYMVF
jgi:hypothetical protein